MGLSGFNRRRELERQEAADKQPGAAKEAKPAKAKPEKKDKAPHAPVQAVAPHEQALAEGAKEGQTGTPQAEQE